MAGEKEANDRNYQKLGRYARNIRTMARTLYQPLLLSMEGFEQEGIMIKFIYVKITRHL